MSKVEPITYMFTDGACAGNQSEKNLGGWGVVLESGNRRLELFGSEADTTNNRMEMTALIKGIEALKKPNQKVFVFSDSSYLINALNDKWYLKWQKNNWKTAAKKPVENQDLWEQIISMLEFHDFSFFRINGHIDLSSKSVDKDSLFQKFISINGPVFDFDDFVHFAEQNNVADLLANKGVNALKSL